MSYTKGPLTIKGPSKKDLPCSDGGDYAVVSQDGKIVAEFFRLLDYGLEADALSNAQLFAAAPDLVEALDSLTAYAQLALNEITDQHTGWYYQLQGAIQKGDKAITKAKGGQP